MASEQYPGVSELCVEALQEALGRLGGPEICNSDQGSQFADEKFTAPLWAKGVGVSMDGKGAGWTERARRNDCGTA